MLQQAWGSDACADATAPAQASILIIIIIANYSTTLCYQTRVQLIVASSFAFFADKGEKEEEEKREKTFVTFAQRCVCLVLL